MSRMDILDRMKSKSMSIQDFNWEQIKGPTIPMIFTPYEVEYLRNAAKSLRYAGNPKKKMEMINSLMESKGFTKYIGGTNRVTYRSYQDSSFIVKIAFNSIGCNDSPAEFRNQQLLKPYVSKIFDVSPCGTIAICERVEPLTNAKQFMSIADKVYTIIQNYIPGQWGYIMADIGTNYYQNWAVRTRFNFGPVLCDYPYMYKLDPKKLFCNAPNPMSPSGFCEGEIDYDPGYNFLYCKRCGAVYKATELAKKIESNELIIRDVIEGKKPMKISISGGSHNVDEIVEAGIYRGEPSIPAGKNLRKVNTTHVQSREKTVNGASTAENKEKNVSTPVTIVPDPVITATPNANEIEDAEFHEVEPEKEVSISVKEDAETGEMKVNKVEVESPIYFDENLKKVSFEKALEAFKAFAEILDKLSFEDRYKLFNTDEFADFVRKYFAMEINFDRAETVDAEDGFGVIIDVSSTLEINRGEDEDVDDICFFTHENDDNFIAVNLPENLVDINEVKKEAAAKDTMDINDAEEEDKLINEADNSGQTYASVKQMAAKTIDIKTIMSNEKSKKVLVLVNDDGGFVTTEGNKLLTITKIDNRDTDTVKVVSAQWFDGVIANMEAEDDEGKESSVGALPQ